MKSPKIRFKNAQGADFPDWSQDSLGSLCQMYQPATLSKQSLDESGPYAVYGANGIIGKHSQFNHAEAEVVVSCRGNCGSVQMTKPCSWINGNAMVVHPKDEKLLEKKFLNYLLSGQNFKGLTTGGAQPQITRGQLSNLSVFFPSCQEQQKIASFFSTLDQKIELNERKLEVLEKLKKGLIQKIYRQEVRCHLNTKNSFLHWSTAKLGEISKIRGRIGFRGYSRSDITDEENGVISLSPANIDRGYVDARTGTYISRDKFEESPEIKVKNGDILFTKTGSTVGKIGIFKDLDLEATINPQMALITPIKVNPHFLMNYLLSHKARKYISSITVGGALPTLSQKELSQMPVPIPSDEEQEEIASLFSAVDQKISIIEIKLVNLRALKQGFMQQMFV